MIKIPFKFGRKDKKLALRRVSKFSKNQKDIPQKSKKARIIKRVLAISAIFIGLMIVVGAIGLIYVIIVYSKELPSPGKPFARNDQEDTQIFDRNGKLLATLYQDQNRQWVNLSDVSKNMQWAMLAAEDINFYNESTGISPTGIIRAAINDVLHRGGGLQGGSTITQQLVKNTVLSDNQTLSRKIEEAILSVEISQRYTKQQILEAYLNEISFGGNIAGIEAASEAYFGIPASQLDLAQSALLAAIPNAPSIYNPANGTDPAAGKQRQQYILDEMLKYKKLTGVTQAQVEAAKNEVLHTQDNALQNNYLAPHFVNYVIGELQQKYGTNVATQGLKVYTTLDYNMQQLAENAVTGAVNDLVADHMNSHNAALVTVDATNGEVMAMVGSYDYSKDLGPTMQGEVNVTTSPRQPGSSIKSLLYATAFQDLGLAPATLMPDIPINVSGYQPHDYNNVFEGPESIRRALGESRNIPAIMTLYSLTPQTFVQQMEKFGYTNVSQYSQDLSIAVGSASVPLIEHTEAYVPFANGSTLYNTTPDFSGYAPSILKIQDKNNKTIYTYDPTTIAKTVIDPKYTYMVTDVLKNYYTLSAVGTGHTPHVVTETPLKAGYHFAAKDGTSNDNIDLTVMGYSPKYVTGMWDGNNDNTPTSAVNYPIQIAPYWNKYMMEINTPYKSMNFTRPSGIVTETVCADTGLLATSNTACTKTTDIFSATQLPKVDDEHTQVQVCNENQNLLATQSQIASGDYTNKTFVQLKTFSPFFQSSLDSWLQAHGTPNSGPPTQTCDNVSSSSPTGANGIVFNSPANGQTFDPGNQVPIQVTLSGISNVASVQFFFNGNAIQNGNLTSAPYNINYTIPSNTAGGTYPIEAEVTESDGTQVSNTENINVTGSNQTSSNVTVTSPANGTTYQQSQAPVTFTGTYNALSSVTQTGFFLTGGDNNCSQTNAGCRFVVSGNNNPFSYTWNSLQGFSGTYQLHAFVISNGVEDDSSNTVSITIDK